MVARPALKKEEGPKTPLFSLPGRKEGNRFKTTSEAQLHRSYSCIFIIGYGLENSGPMKLLHEGNLAKPTTIGAGLKIVS